MASGGTTFGRSFVLSLFRVRENELVLEAFVHTQKQWRLIKHDIETTYIHTAKTIAVFFGGCPEDENDAVGLPRNVGQVVLDYTSSCPTAERA